MTCQKAAVDFGTHFAEAENYKRLRIYVRMNGEIFDNGMAEIVSLAIDASAQCASWDDVCDRVTEHFDATGFLIFEFNFETFSGPKMHASDWLGRAGEQVIMETLESMPKEEQDVFSRFSNCPRQTMVTEAELYGVSHDLEMPENPFRQKVFDTVGSKSRNACRMNDVGPWADVAALHLPIYGSDIPPLVRAQMNFLIPILGKSLETSRIVSAITRKYGALLEAFDLMDFAAAICRNDAQIIISNGKFREMAADADAVNTAGGRLQATLDDGRFLLRNLISAAQSA